MISVAFGLTQYLRGDKQKKIDGLGHYTLELLHALKDQPDLEIIPFSFGLQSQEPVAGYNVKVLNSFRIEVIKGHFFSSLRMNQLAGRGVDLIHATDHLTPYVKGVPLVATLMDAIPLIHPDWCGIQYSSWNKFKIYFWKKIARKANHVITASEYSKVEISKHFDIDPNIITVVPLGVNQRFFERMSAQTIQQILQSFKIHQPFFLHVGTLQPRKNIGRLLAAMRALPEDVRKTYGLVIVGRQGWGVENFKHEIAEAEKAGWCRYLNYVSDVELRALLQSATALIFPSLAEGFGLPVLEGFASRVPVLTSNTTSLPEVCNGASMMFDPTNVDEMAHVMLKVIKEPEQIKTKVSCGHAYAQKMHWKRCAEDTFAVYQKVLAS